MNPDNFVKLTTSVQAQELAIKHPLAFALLSIIALRAKWSEDSKSKLKIGQAIIGSGEFDGHGKGNGMTRREYRTNLNKLVNSGFAAIEKANQGTIVTILNTDIYDISRKQKGQRNDQQSASKRPQTENIRKKKDISPNVDISTGEAKLLFLDRVYLTQKQHDDLQRDCGELWAEVLARLNNYIPNKPGEPYKCHASAIRQWVISRVREESAKKSMLKTVPHDDVEANKKLAKSLENFKPELCRQKSVRIEALGDCLQVTHTTSMAQPFTLRYSEKGFKAQAESYLRKAGLL